MIITLVVNPKSGRGRAAPVAQQVHAALERAGHEVLIETAARDLRVNTRSQLLVIVGGDGTVHHVAPHAIAAHIPLYQIPMGTENLFARQFGMTRDIDRLVNALARPNIRATDAAYVSHASHQPASSSAVIAQQEREPAAEIGVRDPALPTAFFLMLSIGPDAGVVHRLAAARVGAIGHWSYLRPILDECLTPALRPLSVEADGSNLFNARPGLLVVANSREYGVRINPASRASISDGLLDLVFFPAASAAELVVWALRSRLGRHTRSRRLIYHTARQFRVTSHAPHTPYQLDGEAGRSVGAAHLGIDISIQPGVLQVLTPSTSL